MINKRSDEKDLKLQALQSAFCKSQLQEHRWIQPKPAASTSDKQWEPLQDHGILLVFWVLELGCDAAHPGHGSAVTKSANEGMMLNEITSPSIRCIPSIQTRGGVAGRSAERVANELIGSRTFRKTLSLADVLNCALSLMERVTARQCINGQHNKEPLLTR